MIKWFKNIQNYVRLLYSILTFSSIYFLTFFNNAIQIAKEICDIPDNDISIKMHARNTLLFSNGEPWVKKDGDETSDTPMG